MYTRALSGTVRRRTVLSVLVGILSLPTLAQSSVGSGPSLRFPAGIEVEATGTLVVVDSALGAVLRVDPVTGNRTVISDANTGSGPPLSFPQGIAVEGQRRPGGQCCWPCSSAAGGSGHRQSDRGLRCQRRQWPRL